MKRGTGTADRISLAWPYGRNDKETRLIMYKMAIEEAVAGIRRGDTAFQGGFYVRLLTSRFEKYDRDFPFDRLNDLLFVSSPWSICSTFLRLNQCMRTNLDAVTSKSTAYSKKSPLRWLPFPPYSTTLRYSSVLQPHQRRICLIHHGIRFAL